MSNGIRTGQGRRRGRGGPRPPQMGGRPELGNRVDHRQRGNAAQLLEKYKTLARDAQLSGDRVTAEYYLQYADHYHRVLNENRPRFEERPRQDWRGDEVESDGVETGPIDEPRAFEREYRGQAGGEDTPDTPGRRGDDGYARDERPRQDERFGRDERPRGDGRAGRGEWRPRDERAARGPDAPRGEGRRDEPFRREDGRGEFRRERDGGRDAGRFDGEGRRERFGREGERADGAEDGRRERFAREGERAEDGRRERFAREERPRREPEPEVESIAAALPPAFGRAAEPPAAGEDAPAAPRRRGRPPRAAAPAEAAEPALPMPEAAPDGAAPPKRRGRPPKAKAAEPMEA